MNKLSHKGYTGSIEVSFEDNCLHGRVHFIEDIVSYEGETVDDLATSFEDAVDRYVDYCKTRKADFPLGNPPFRIETHSLLCK